MYHYLKLYNKKFSLIDWRQDFAGIDVGDVYYDLGKMYGGILMSYDLMKDDTNFSCSEYKKNHIFYEYASEPVLEEFKFEYEKWILDNGYDLKQVKQITALIWLNMAPLHENKFGDLLFFKSKKALQEIEDGMW